MVAFSCKDFRSFSTLSIRLTWLEIYFRVHVSRLKDDRKGDRPGNAKDLLSARLELFDRQKQEVGGDLVFLEEIWIMGWNKQGLTDARG